MTTLFVNACLRGEESRTLDLCREYLAAAGDEVQEVDLAKLDLKPFDAQMVEYRTQKQMVGELDDPIFALAHQFADADAIVVGAPYWDLSFPAALKVYIEHVCAGGVVFRYTEDGRCESLCRAQNLTYITTCGGGAGANLGFEYVRAFAGMCGISDVRCIKAENLDVIGNDIEAELEKARAQIRQFVSSI